MACIWAIRQNKPMRISRPKEIPMDYKALPFIDARQEEIVNVSKGACHKYRKQNTRCVKRKKLPEIRELLYIASKNIIF